ncbi:mpv17-like protein 2 [Anoplophora glabripennis]|uniref:mpv17-like protein 2 n=1 Tax=Anoplophora glabripennis TaxID=217634 RepID=UPI00087551D3|nr:mpv17-like protein 2 [Anoplophora glabripennis]XP_018562270.1 mpv17-like protein 2 [Anoplophora glabripennis]
MLKNLLKIKFPTTVRYMSSSRCRPSPIRVGISLAFGKYLFVTNTISSGVLMLLGDCLQQEIEYQNKKLTKRYDYGRLNRMFLIGLAFGSINHYFYIWMAKIMPDRSKKTARRKLILDQIIMSPLCIIIFFYGMGLMESKSLPECTKELKSKFWDVYVMDFFLCAPSQFINFYYVPVKYQVFYVNAIALVYSMFLSYFKHN